MQKTYKGKTAGGILASARMVKMQAGTIEVVVTLSDGQDAIVMLGERGDGYGGRVADVCVLADVDGVIARLSTTAASYRRLRELERAADKGLRA